MNWYQQTLSKTAKKKKNLLVDLDGTIAQDAKYPAIGKPFKGVKEALEKLRKAGFRIRIYTCRLNGKQWKDTNDHQCHNEKYDEILDQIRDYLKENEIPYDDIVEWDEGKPVASWYIDNRGLQFDGDWESIVEKVLKEED